MKTPLTLIVLFFISQSIWAKDAEDPGIPLAAFGTWNFKSSQDDFSFTVSKSEAEMNGKEIDATQLRWFFEIFSWQPDGSCPSISASPDLTVQFKPKGKSISISRMFYREDGIMREGDKCSSLAGKSGYGLPVHRDFFTGDSTGHIDLTRNFEVRGKDLNLKFSRTENGWSPESSKFLVHDEFMEKFVSSLESFKIDGRAHPDVKKFGTVFTVKTEKAEYELVSIDDTLWALGERKSKLLLVSRDWSFWGGLTMDHWSDFLNPDYLIFINKSAQVSKRIGALKKLKDSENRFIKNIFITSLRNDQEDIELKKNIIEIFVGRPNPKNVKLVIAGLESYSPPLRRYATSRLRLLYSKGPTIEVDDSHEALTRKIQAWIKWANSL